MLVNVDNAIIDIALRAIDNEIDRLQVAKAVLLQAKEKQVGESPTGKDPGKAPADDAVKVPDPGKKEDGPTRAKKKAEQKAPDPKRPKEVRRYVTQTDIVTVLERARTPLSELHIKEQLDTLLNVKPSDATIANVLAVSHWKAGAKRYRKNGDGKYELYDAEDEEGSDA